MCDADPFMSKNHIDIAEYVNNYTIAIAKKSIIPYYFMI